MTDLKWRLDIEQAAVRSWPALEACDIDGWLWRHTSGGSIRANTVATLAFTGDVDAAIDRVESLYRKRGGPPAFTLTDVSAPADLDARLAARGYRRGDDHVTMTKQVDTATTLPQAVAVGVTPTSGWMETYLSGLTPDRRTVAPRLIANLPNAHTVYVAAEQAGIARSSGLTVIDGALASVQCMATLPAARRGGGARRVLEGIEAIAAQNMVRWLYLQTAGDNAAAMSLYHSYGFTVTGHYHTRTGDLQRA